MLDSEKRISRFREIIQKVKQKFNLSIDLESLGENLNLAFDELLVELRNYDLEIGTCVELVDLLLFDEKTVEKSTVSRLPEKYEGYSDFMLGSYMKLGIAPDDSLLQSLVLFDLDKGFTVDQLVTSGWFYYRNWNFIAGLEEVVFKSRRIWDTMHKVVIKTRYQAVSYF